VNATDQSASKKSCAQPRRGSGPRERVVAAYELQGIEYEKYQGPGNTNHDRDAGGALQLVAQALYEGPARGLLRLHEHAHLFEIRDRIPDLSGEIPEQQQRRRHDEDVRPRPVVPVSEPQVLL